MCVCVGQVGSHTEVSPGVVPAGGFAGGPSCPGCLQPECLGSSSAHRALGKRASKVPGGQRICQGREYKGVVAGRRSP